MSTQRLALDDPALAQPVQSRENSWEALEEIAGESPELAALAVRARSLVTVNTFADQTIRSYSNSWRRFEEWCEVNGLEALPASPLVVVLYVAHLDERGVGKESVVSARASIAWKHAAKGWESPAAHPLVAEVASGATRRRASSGEAKPIIRAHPISVPELREMMSVLPEVRFRRRAHEELMRVCLRSQLLAGWHLGRRADELVRADLTWIKAEGEGVEFSTSSQKNKPHGFSNVMMTTADESICPVRALHAWLEASAPYRNGVTRLWCDVRVGEDGEPILLDRLADLIAERRFGVDLKTHLGETSTAEVEAKIRAEATGQIVALFRARMQQWMRKAGIEPLGDDRRLSAHSARRGLTTSARAAGVDLEAIAQHVGWASIEMARLYSDHRSSEHPLQALDL